MGAIKIKGINSSIVIELNSGLWLREQDEFQRQLRLLADHGLHCAEVFFDSLPNQQQLVDLYDVLNEQDCLITSIKIRKPETIEPSWKMMMEPLRSGENQNLLNSTILIRDVRRSVSLQLEKGDLVVMGVIHGQITVTEKTSRIYCMGLDHARIKIADSEWQELTDSAKLCVYYENQKCCCLRLEEKGSWENVL